MPSKRSQSHKAVQSLIPFIGHAEKDKTIVMVSRSGGGHDSNRAGRGGFGGQENLGESRLR